MIDFRPEPAVLELVVWAGAVFAVCTLPNLVSRLIFMLLKGVLP